MAKLQESLENKKPPFTFYNDLFMYSDQLWNRLEQSGTDMQDILCELMSVYQSYNDFIQTKQYVVRGSMLKCHFGTEPAAILTIDEARLLLEEDLAGKRKNTIKLIENLNTNHEFTDYEIDAITSVLFNGNKINNPNSFVYYLLRPDQYDSEDALNILCTADAKGWYGNNGGLLRRRLMEYNVYFNNDYTYYDSKELEELKDIVGW